MNKIPFNKPYFTGSEFNFMHDCIEKGKTSGNGYYTLECQKIFENKFDFGKCLLTSSCSDALEMAAILLEIEPGDEVIMPSYNFMSAANAFILRGANIVFVDSRKDHPGIDELKIEEKITRKTKAIVLVHYAGVSCDMNIVQSLVEKHNLFLVEDSAHAIDSFFQEKGEAKKFLGTFGNLSTFSFHETKNIISGEGGMLAINDDSLIDRGEVIWEKGTNRSQFQRGVISKYEWIDIGSSFLPSEFTAAILYSQLQNVDIIQRRRIEIWNYYYENLASLFKKGFICPPFIPSFAVNNAHMFYIITRTSEERTKLIEHMLSDNVLAVFHYQSLHKSPYFKKKSVYEQKELPNSDKYSDCLLRLPLYFELTKEDQNRVIESIMKFYH